MTGPPSIGVADGAWLHGLVEAYAALGDHRTGSAVDHVTAEWLAAELEEAGAKVRLDPWDFERFVPEWSLESAGQSVESLPLFYAGTGARVDTATPTVRPLELAAGVSPIDLDGTLAALPAGGAAVLVAQSNEGRLIGINRRPSEAVPLPVVVAAGREEERLYTGPLRLRFEARLETATSANVVAAFGGNADDPYVVTTPLTGWFRCAGERGTGIAVAIAVARWLAKRHPVLVIATTGHELGHLGARVFRRSTPRLRPRAVLHLGASIAAGNRAADGTFEIPEHRYAFTASVADAAVLNTYLLPAKFELIPNLPGPWPGEGEEWRETGAPILSFTGAARTFHSPDDLPGIATSPAWLAVVCETIVAAAEILPGLAVTEPLRR